MEKPLHVQVAEALGWTAKLEAKYSMPRYDIEWESAGPVVEKYRLRVFPDLISTEWHAAEHYWQGGSGEEHLIATANTPLEAVCKLVLAMKAAGKI